MRRMAVALGLGWALASGTATAQEDFRAADLGRPVDIEDAVPLELHGWEVAGGVRAEWSEERAAAVALEVEAGVFPDAQVGVEGVGEWREDEELVLEGLAVHALYGTNRETRTWPAFALRGEVETPAAGGTGEDPGWRTSLLGIATRSVDRLRLHLNAGYTWAGGTGEDLVRGAFGFDVPVGLFSRAVLGALVVEAPTGSGDTRVMAEVGARWQLSNATVLDLGAFGRLDRWADGEGGVGVVAGLSRAFGVAALTPVPPYPEPRID